MNISLTGMPASGKTTAARALKKLMKNCTLIDTDLEIEKMSNLQICSIFEKYGEEYFRNLETQVLEKILRNDNQIISTGGGIVKRDENIKLLKQNSIMIYLKTDINILAERAGKSALRPLLNNEEAGKKLLMLFKERDEKYNQAHIIIDTKDLTPYKTAEKILEKVNEYIKR